MKLIRIGDSLTFGYGVHLSQRWTRLCAQETGWELVNEGINGDTTGGMLARMQGGVLAELREGGLGADRPYVLLMGGSNDVFYSGSDAAARENMGAMIHQLFSVGVLPVVGIPLPLISYGGTVMLSIMASFGIILCVHINRNVPLGKD
mgnify:CR=1 FL=1